MYRVQIQYQDGLWHTMIHVMQEDVLDLAIAACGRCVMAYKCPSRVIGIEHSEIVHERLYNQTDDPDCRDWNEAWQEDEDFELDWMETGF